MKISGIGSLHNSFNATFVSNITRQDVEKYYNPKINALETKRDELIDFDSFMNSEKIQSLISALPEKDEISLQSLSMDTDDAFLMYTPADAQSMKKFESIPVSQAVNLAFQTNISEDGRINKNAVTKWLSDIISFIGK